MHILIVTQYFHPEVGATQTRMLQFARGLSQKGHRVTVVTEFPNHPHGRIPQEYRGKLFTREAMDGFTVLRTWVWASPTKTFWNRIAFYLSYMTLAAVRGMLLRGRVDVVLATSPPLFVGVSGWAIARWKGARLILDIRDIWPAAAQALGELSNPVFLRWAERLERWLYRKADRITAVTRSFCSQIAATSGQPGKIQWLPNGTVGEIFNPEMTLPELRSRLKLEGKFVVTYAGTHGVAQGLPAVLSAAELLSGEPVAFLFIGEGPVKAALMRQAEGLGLKNVIFHPQVPLNEVTPFLNLSDALLVPLRDEEIFRSTIPSKLFDSLACGKPVLLGVDGEAREVLEESGGGVFFRPEDPAALAGAVRSLMSRPEQARAMGVKGRKFVMERFTRAKQAEQLAELIAGIT